MFADEPTSALDWENGQKVIELLRDAAHERGAIDPGRLARPPHAPVRGRVLPPGGRAARSDRSQRPDGRRCPMTGSEPMASGPAWCFGRRPRRRPEPDRGDLTLAPGRLALGRRGRPAGQERRRRPLKGGTDRPRARWTPTRRRSAIGPPGGGRHVHRQEGPRQERATRSRPGDPLVQFDDAISRPSWSRPRPSVKAAEFDVQLAEEAKPNARHPGRTASGRRSRRREEQAQAGRGEPADRQGQRSRRSLLTKDLLTGQPYTEAEKQKMRDENLDIRHARVEGPRTAGQGRRRPEAKLQRLGAGPGGPQDSAGRGQGRRAQAGRAGGSGGGGPLPGEGRHRRPGRAGLRSARARPTARPPASRCCAGPGRQAGRPRRGRGRVRLQGRPDPRARR